MLLNVAMLGEQHISAQVWTCTRCGGEDPKSCGCTAATAVSRELQAAKAETHRQANRRSYAKTKQNQRSSDNPTPIDNTGEFAEGKAWPDDDPPDVALRKLIYNRMVDAIGYLLAKGGRGLSNKTYHEILDEVLSKRKNL